MKREKLYFTYSDAVFFDDKIDKANGWVTIVFNYKKDSFIKVKQPGYKILRLIDENPGLNILRLTKKVQKNKDYVNRFIQQMIRENIILAK